MWNLITFSFERILLLLLLQLVTLQNGSAKLIQNHAEDSRIAIEEEEGIELGALIDRDRAIESTLRNYLGSQVLD